MSSSTPLAAMPETHNRSTNSNFCCALRRRNVQDSRFRAAVCIKRSGGEDHARMGARSHASIAARPKHLFGSPQQAGRTYPQWAGKYHERGSIASYRNSRPTTTKACTSIRAENRAHSTLSVAGSAKTADWIRPLYPRGSQHVPHFLPAERLGKQVVAAEIEHLRPQ